MTDELNVEVTPEVLPIKNPVVEVEAPAIEPEVSASKDSIIVEITKSFYDALESLRLEKEAFPESKALVAEVWAHISKAVKTLEKIAQL